MYLPWSWKSHLPSRPPVSWKCMSCLGNYFCRRGCLVLARVVASGRLVLGSGPAVR